MPDVRQAVRTVVDVVSGFTGRFGIPSRELIGGYQFDNVVLRPEEFIVVDEFPSSPYESDGDQTD